jgi:hypothetical protein
VDPDAHRAMSNPGDELGTMGTRKILDVDVDDVPADFESAIGGHAGGVRTKRRCRSGAKRDTVE